MLPVSVRPTPPGPFAWPVVGNIPEITAAGGALQYLEQMWRRYGDLFRVVMERPSVIVVHPDAIQRVLQTHTQVYVKGQSYDGVRRVIGNGVLALEGAEWKARRALLQPAFHRASLAKLADVMVARGALFFDGLGKEHGSTAFTVDVHRTMVDLTLDVVVAALFGQRDGGEISYEALGAALELVSERANGVPLPEWLPTAGNRKYKRTMAEVEGAVYGVIAEGRANPQPGTLLAMLLDSRDEETGAGLDDRAIRDEVFTLFIAGHETTALTLTWLFTLLVDQPEVVQRMVAEVDALGDRDPAFEDLPRLAYVRQVIDETLRLRGPVGMTARDVVADDEINGFRIPAGYRVLPFFHGVHRHPEFWDEPARFDPDRFSPERSKGRHPWCYVPFSGGKRRCIGDQFSLVETTLLLSQLLRRFTFTIDPAAAKVEPNMIITVRPNEPVKVTFRRR